MPRGSGYMSDSGIRKSTRQANALPVLVFDFIDGVSHVYNGNNKEDYSLAATGSLKRIVAAVDLGQAGIQNANHLSASVPVQFMDTSSELSQDSINSRISAE